MKLNYKSLQKTDMDKITKEINKQCSYTNKNFLRKLHQEKELLKGKYEKNAYRTIIYQTIFDLSEAKTIPEHKAIYKRIKERKVLRDDPRKNDFKTRLEEHDNYVVKPFEVVAGVFECSKCGSDKTFTCRKQIRGSDESMTIFSKCAECGNKWHT